MANPITITATLAAWVSKGYSQRDLMDCVERGDGVGAVNALTIYGSPDKKEFSEYIRVGEADVTVRLIPKDEQTKRMVQALQAQLDEERISWHARQQAILAEISKLQALTFDGTVDDADAAGVRHRSAA
jgi:hypothetical protein